VRPSPRVCTSCAAHSIHNNAVVRNNAVVYSRYDNDGDNDNDGDRMIAVILTGSLFANLFLLILLASFCDRSNLPLIMV